MCQNFGVCETEDLNRGWVFPENATFSELRLSDYYKDITYKIEELIGGLEITTAKKNSETHKR